MKKILSTALVCALLAGCGGGGGTSVAPSTPTGGSKTSQATLHFKFNNAKSIGGSARGRNYISRNTLGMGISFRATGTTAVTFGTTETALQSPMWTTNINPGYNANLTTCTSADPTGAFTCTVVIAVPAGYDDFQITTWDAAPQTAGTNGTFASTANDLSTAIVGNQYVQVNANNAFNYALSGVVNSVVLTPSVQQLVSGAALGATDAGGAAINPASVTLSVLAKDFDGNIIIGNEQFVDVNGTPVTIDVTKAETDGSTGTAAPANGNVTFASATGATNQVPPVANTCTATSCTFNSPGTVSVAYDGYDTQSASFSATLSGGAGGSIPVLGSAITFTQSTNGLGVPGPLAITEFAHVAPGAGYFANGALGPDGNAWFADYTGALQKVSPGGSTIVSYFVGGAPYDVTSGPDGKVWFTGATISGTLGRVNVDGSGVTDMSAGLLHPSDSYAYGAERSILLGHDNRLWIAEYSTGYLDVVNADGTNYASYNVGGHPSDMVYGPNQHYWYVDGSNFTVNEFDPASGTVVHTVSGAFASSGIAVGPDGNLYGINGSNGFKIDTSSYAVTTYNLPAGSGVFAPQDVVTGSDGNIWVTAGASFAGAYNGLARMTTSGAITLYSNNISTGSVPWGIVAGSDGNIYFAENYGQKTGEVQL